MCGRYFIDMDPSDDQLAEIMQDLNRRRLTGGGSAGGASAALKTAGEIFPTDTVPVVANSRERGTNRPGRARAFAMRWGYTLSGSRRIINARSETAAQRPLFADGMRARRLLIPASGYYEWLRHDSKSRKYAIRLDGSDALYMAGLYRFEAGVPVFTILTRESAPSVAFIHDRMPVILPREAASDWLNPDYDAQDVLRAAALRVTATAI